MNLGTYIRKLSRSSYWQEIYRSSKECNGIRLFENETNISGLQCLFLYWTRIYSLLFTEMVNGDWPILDQDVIKDDDRCDAFLFWRTKEIDKKSHENKKAQKKNSMKKGQKSFNIYKGKK